MIGDKRVCPVCGSGFDQLSTNHVFCSGRCASKAERSGEALRMRRAAFEPYGFECRGCGKAVAVTEFGDFRESWCSRECKARASARRKRQRKRMSGMSVVRAWQMEKVRE